MELGRGKVHGTMQGSHLAPVIDGSWNLPDAQAEGSLTLEQETIRMSAHAPALDMSGVLHVRPAAHEDMKRVVTQAEMAELTALVLEGAEVDADLKVRSFSLSECHTSLKLNMTITASHPMPLGLKPAPTAPMTQRVCVDLCQPCGREDVCCHTLVEPCLPHSLTTQLYWCRAWMCCPSCLPELQLISIWRLGSPCGCV